MSDAPQIIEDVWDVAQANGFNRDGASDQGRMGEWVINVGYTYGSIRVRFYRKGDLEQVIDIDTRTRNHFGTVASRLVEIAVTGE